MREFVLLFLLLIALLVAPAEPFDDGGVGVGGDNDELGGRGEGVRGSSSRSGGEAGAEEGGNNVEEEDDSRRRHRKAIVGGNAVTGPTVKYPWFVHNGECGGALIAPDVFVTAAHCFYPVGQAVYLNTHQHGPDFGLGTRKQILGTVKHPNYNELTDEYDIMLVKIEKTDDIETIQFNSNASVPHDGESLTLMGFGATSTENLQSEDNKFPDDLQEVTIAAYSNRKCGKKKFVGDLFFPESMICAAAAGKAPCHGDSGGPLITHTDPPVVTGIVSFQDRFKCAKEGSPVVFTRMSSVSKWVTRTMCILTETDICNVPVSFEVVVQYGSSPHAVDLIISEAFPVNLVLSKAVKLSKPAGHCNVTCITETYTQEDAVIIDPNLPCDGPNTTSDDPNTPSDDPADENSDWLESGKQYWIWVRDLSALFGGNGVSVEIIAKRQGRVIWNKVYGAGALEKFGIPLI